MTKEQQQKLDLVYGRSLAQADEIRSLQQQVEQLMKRFGPTENYNIDREIKKIYYQITSNKSEWEKIWSRNCSNCGWESLDATSGCIEPTRMCVKFNHWKPKPGWYYPPKPDNKPPEQPKPQESLRGKCTCGRNNIMDDTFCSLCEAPKPQEPTEHGNILREQLAEYAHDAWCGWMKYMFSKAELNADGTWTMPQWAVERWQRQMNTKYGSLPEDEKKSDREEAEKMLSIMADFALSLKEGWQREGFDAGRKETFKSTGDYSGHWGFDYSSYEDWNRDKNGKREGV